jgi:hypothetical protein
MVEKEILLLEDKLVVPTDELIFSLIGEKKSYWQNIMDYMRVNYPESAGEWNYYNDGKRWLFKMVLKKKTVFWGAILTGTFRITFYFGDKAEPVIIASDLPVSIKEGFKTSKRFGATRAISIKMNEGDDLENVLKLIAIKVRMK